MICGDVKPCCLEDNVSAFQEPGSKTTWRHILEDRGRKTEGKWKG